MGRSYHTTAAAWGLAGLDKQDVELLLPHGIRVS